MASSLKKLSEAANESINQSAPRMSPSDCQKHGIMALEARFDIAGSVAFLLDGGFKQVALQFPDDLLPFAARVLQEGQLLVLSSRDHSSPRSAFRESHALTVHLLLAPFVSAPRRLSYV